MALGRGALGWVMCGGLLLGCASRQSKPEVPVVRNLRITGNDHLSSRQIEKRILTRATGWWPFATKRTFDATAWAADLQRIVRLYAAKGFYQAAIAKAEVVPKPPGGVDLEARVEEGQPTHVGKVEIQGMDALPADDREAALDRLPLATGAVFEESAWSAAKDRIKTRLRNRGYAKVEVSGLALVDVQTRLASLTLVVRARTPLPVRRDRGDDRAGRAHPRGADLGAGADRDPGGADLQRRGDRGGPAAVGGDGAVRVAGGGRGSA